MNEYVFFRRDGFYTMEFGSDIEAIASALHNDGTYKVESLMGRVVWPTEEKYVLAIEDIDFINKGHAYLVTEEEGVFYEIIDGSMEKGLYRKESFRL